MTIDEIQKLINRIESRQEYRLRVSKLSLNDFFNQREEQDVTDELNRLNTLLDSAERHAA